MEVNTLMVCLLGFLIAMLFLVVGTRATTRVFYEEKRRHHKLMMAGMDDFKGDRI